MQWRKIIYWYFIGIPLWLQAQGTHDLLKSGPMCGTSQMKEAQLWVQTTRACEVYFKYFPIDEPAKIFQTQKKISSAERYFTVCLLADSVEPGKKYQYQLFLNKKEQKWDYPLTFSTPSLWQHRTEPPDFKIAMGSCLYVNEPVYDRPGKPYGGEYQILTHIPEHNPDVMLWMGDNIYFREADWGSETGMIHRYRHTRALPELQKLLRTTVNLAIWDDHDYGPNDADRSYENKELSQKMFKLFWPQYYISNQGIQSFFQWSDIDFILLDNRWNRTPNASTDENKTIIGEDQKQWLKDRLLTSNATFKCVAMGGQFLNTWSKYENYAMFNKERLEILNFIKENNIKNVIFLTGDRHHTDLSRTPFSPTIYDLTVSPLTSGAYPSPNEGNEWQMKGHHVGKRNFAILHFSGPRKQRILTIEIFDSNNELQWKEQIQAEP